MTRPDPVVLAELEQRVLDIRQGRIARQAARPPAIAAEVARRKAEIQPRIQHLMSEFGMARVEATAVAADDDAWYRGQRAEVLLKAAEKSPTRALSSIALISPQRQAAPPPTPERKPGEDYAAFKRRIAAHVAKLARSAGAPGGKETETMARPAAAGTPDVALAAERTEKHYPELKAQMLGSKPAKVREVTHHAETAVATTLAESKSVHDRALERMRSLGQSTDRGSADFAEDYKGALKALEGIK